MSCMLPRSPLERSSQDAVRRLPCPFFSLQVALLCMRALMAPVCLSAGDWDWSSQHLCLIWVQHSYHPMGPWSGQNPLPLGLMGEEAALSRVSGGWGNVRTRTQVSWHFSVPVPGWNSYLGSRRGSEKRDGEGAGGSGLKLSSLLLDRLFLRRGFQHDVPQYKRSLLVTTGTLELLNLEEADVSFCTALLL